MEQSNIDIKSSYSDRIVKEMMLEIMKKYDTDGNKLIDHDEFSAIVTDSDVDMFFSLYR